MQKARSNTTKQQVLVMAEDGLNKLGKEKTHKHNFFEHLELSDFCENFENFRKIRKI